MTTRMLTLPTNLDDAIRAALGTVPEARWLREAQALSQRYRGERSDQTAPLASGDVQALGYAALILPATYAQLRGAMAATAQRIPSWQPRSMLDLGSGPGTALWAASEQWPSISRFSAWEREKAFIALGKKLASNHTVLNSTRWEQHDLTLVAKQPVATERFDLVVLGHVLNELPAATRQAIVGQAWALTAGMLLIVEPGTSAAFPIVREARDQLLAASAETIAPCAHNRPCPLQGDWCHFPQRIERPAYQRKAREALGNWEDSKFCYAAMARFTVESPIWGRVIREPTWNKAYAEALVSATDGVHQHRALKRHREQFRETKELRWGEALQTPLESVE